MAYRLIKKYSFKLSVRNPVAVKGEYFLFRMFEFLSLEIVGNRRTESLLRGSHVSLIEKRSNMNNRIIVFIAL